MSMHLEGPWLSSISTKARAEKITKAQRDELERNWRDRNKRLKEIGLPKQTFEDFLDFVHGRKTEKKADVTSGTVYKKAINNTPKKTFSLNQGLPDLSYRVQTKKCSGTDTETETNDEVSSVPLEVTRPDIWVKGATSSKPSPTYTGTKVVGIAQMAKSNAVPVFSNNEIIDIARMRR